MDLFPGPNFRIFNNDSSGDRVSPGILREFSELVDRINSLECYIDSIQLSRQTLYQESSSGLSSVDNENTEGNPVNTWTDGGPVKSELREEETSTDSNSVGTASLPLRSFGQRPKDSERVQFENPASSVAVPRATAGTLFEETSRGERVRKKSRSPNRSLEFKSSEKTLDPRSPLSEEVAMLSTDPKNKTPGYCSSATGFGNMALAFASKAEGKGAKARLRTQQSYASGSFAIPGDAQYTRIILKGKTKSSKSILKIDNVGDYTFFGTTSNTLLKITTFGSSEQGSFFYAKHKFITFISPTTITLVEISKDKKDSGIQWEIEITIEDRILNVEVTTSSTEEVKWLSMAESLETHHMMNLID